MAKQDITLDQLRDSYDWAEVFGEGSGGNTTNTVEASPPGSTVSIAPVSRADVVQVIAAANGVNDEDEWVGVFLLKDGRFLVASGSCDYTGWDCQASNSLVVLGTWLDTVNFGLSQSQRLRLDIDQPDPTKLMKHAGQMYAILRDLSLLDSGPERPGELARLCDAARAIVVEVERT